MAWEIANFKCSEVKVLKFQHDQSELTKVPKTGSHMDMGDGDVCDNWEQYTDDTDRLEKQLEKLTVEKPAVSLEKGEVKYIRDNNVMNPMNSINSQSVPGPTPQFRLLVRNKDSIGVEIGNVRANLNAVVSRCVELDSTTEESLRTQYSPPQPQLKILSRPKNSTEYSAAGGPTLDKKSQTTKSFKQREKEYSEARMRILGDVRFLEEEKEAELESSMSPSEILKLKISKSLLEDAKEISEPSDMTTTGEDGIVTQNNTSETTTPGSSKSKSKRKSKARTTNPGLNITPPIHFPPTRIDSERIFRQPRGPDGTSGFHSPR